MHMPPLSQSTQKNRIESQSLEGEMGLVPVLLHPQRDPPVHTSILVFWSLENKLLLFKPWHSLWCLITDKKPHQTGDVRKELSSKSVVYLVIGLSIAVCL